MAFLYLSVIIPTYNRLDMLLRVLDALEQQEDPPEFEVIIIDDGSTDETARVLGERAAASAERTTTRFVFRSQPNGGPGTARNHGVTLATGRFVVFMGD